MVGGRNLTARTEHISALAPLSSAIKYEQFESDYASIDYDSDESLENQRVRRAKSSKSRREPHTPIVNESRSKSALRSAYQHDSIEQKQVPLLNLDPINNHYGLKTVRILISIDATPFQKVTPEPKIVQMYPNRNKEQFYSRHAKTPIEHSRKRHSPTKRANNVADYFDDWYSDYSDDSKSDYSDDSKSDMDELPKPKAVFVASRSKSKTANNSINLLPSDPTAFDASFCRKHQVAIDDMSYRHAINSWRAKNFSSVVKLIKDLSSGKSAIDRAWIVFYWVSQNIEYDVEAYFSGNIRHQTSDDIFRSGKGVCDAFGTIFKTLCNAVHIECKKINGYAKGHGFKTEQKSYPRADHAWNAVRLRDHWYLVDPTWGEGYLDRNDCNRKELTPFYFLIRPEQMIYTHLPEDPQWQLLVFPVSMNDFLRLPHVYPTFFEYSIDIIYPRYSNMASFNSSLGLSEVLIRSPSDVSLIGHIEKRRSGKIENGSLIQYDADRQLWQCLFAPRRSGFHTLTLFARRKTELTKSETTKHRYSCVVELGLDVSTDIIKTNTFPLTYGLFTGYGCQIFEPLGGTLKPGSKVTIHCRIPGASCARLRLDGDWFSEDRLKDGIFKRQITIPRREITMYVKFSDKRQSSGYDGLFRYSIK